MLGPPSSAWLAWLISGSRPAGGIMNSNMLGGRGCERTVFPCPLHARTPWLHQRQTVLLPPPDVSGMAGSPAEKFVKRVQQRLKRAARLVCEVASPRLHSVLLSFLLLIHSRLSLWSFDAGDATVVLILSPQELWRCSTVIGAGGAQGNPSWDKMRGWEESTRTSDWKLGALTNTLSETYCTTLLPDSSFEISNMYVRAHMHTQTLCLSLSSLT